MPKTVNVEISKAFDILPGHKYLVVLPKIVHDDPTVGAALTRLFEGSEMVGLMIDKPNDVKVIDVGEVKDAKTDSQN